MAAQWSFSPQTSSRVRTFTDAAAAVAYVRELYDANTTHLRECFARVARGENPEGSISAGYPYISINATSTPHADTRLSFGVVPKLGRYATTLTRPDIFERYYVEQFSLLLLNHDVELEVGVSDCPIPIHFAFRDGVYVEGELEPSRLAQMRYKFDLPDLEVIDDSIANGNPKTFSGETLPLSLFSAPRVDYSLHRLRHYTATDPACFQKFVIFTNYQFYVDEFVRMGLSLMEKARTPDEACLRSEYTGLVEPGGYTTFNANREDRSPEGRRAERMPQMPAYHLMREDGCGITIINIGVGPSNARNISDHVAVLRPHAWLMLGHCAGLRQSQKLGDYVLAHAYVRDDHALDKELPIWVPIPALAEVQQALESAVATVTGHAGFDLKSVMRTGTVVTTDNRNWEIAGYDELVERFSQSRAIALDMESAVIAANGFRYRVPYGSLLCVSDKPLHGEIKLAGMANHFYRNQVEQHLKIGVKALEILRNEGGERLHSRKLRSFIDTPFR